MATAPLFKSGAPSWTSLLLSLKNSKWDLLFKERSGSCVCMVGGGGGGGGGEGAQVLCFKC